MKNNLYRVSINVHPAVKRYLSNMFSEIDGAYDVKKSIYYYMVTAMLMQSGMKIPSKVSKKYCDYVPVVILVTEYDFYHYGYQCSELQQVRFNRTMLHLITDDACRKIALARVLLGQPVTKCIEHYLIENLYEDNEMSRESLRTIYRRKYVKYERELSEYYSNLLTDFESEDENIAKKINGQIDHYILKV